MGGIWRLTGASVGNERGGGLGRAAMPCLSCFTSIEGGPCGVASICAPDDAWECSGGFITSLSARERMYRSEHGKFSAQERVIPSLMIFQRVIWLLS